MKKTTKVISWLNMGSFPGYTMFILGFSFDQVKKHLKKKKATEWLDAFEWAIKENTGSGCWANQMTLENKKTKVVKQYFIIYLPSFDFSDYAYAKLAHECLHICQFYLPDILDRNKEHEAECYLHTHLMMQIMKEIRGEVTA